MSDYGKLFLRALVTALPKISKEYFECPNANLKAAENYLDNPHQKEKAFCFGERLFCYELYHQLRILLAPLLNNRELTLHGELQKPLLEAMAGERVGARRLDKKYIPDFILHYPGIFKKDGIITQEVMMEVKADPKLKFKQIHYDLKKIGEFIDRYMYKMGVFLAININIQYLKDELQNHATCLNKINNTSKIYIIVCESPEKEVFCGSLRDICKYFAVNTDSVKRTD